MTNKSRFSDEATADLRLLSSAVRDVLDITTTAFLNDDLKLAQKVEPLEQVIDKLTLKTKDSHIVRMQNGRCSIELGFILADLLNNFSRIADHCSNIAVCMIEISHGSLDTHEYLNHVKTSDEEFLREYDLYRNKYVL